jgi:hypothetical protein
MKGKGNDGSGDNKERDGWETSKELFNKLDKQYKFKFDCCATKDNTKCENFSNDFKEIKGTNLNSWMNPPFSNAKEMFEHFFNAIICGVAIYRCDNMETKIWQEIILKKADWIFIPKGRVSYTPFNITIRNGMTRFPSALIGIGVEPPKEIEGIILSVIKEDLK